ncbi:MAG: PQQ-binding-like beta-propeller repeat protein, partial [Pirellulaceae bacterium]|nr:PQQ-binding-like beta-propeller repeat protein [Pirellulaceae bacterium]
SIAPLAADELSRRGTLPRTMPSTTYAFDARTGEKKWEFKAEYDPRNLVRSWQSVRANDDWIAYSHDKNIVLLGKWSETTAIDATSGKTLWKNRSGVQPIVLREDTFINQAGRQYSITTGELASQSTFFRKSGGCNYAVGSKHLMLVRNRSATYFDVSDQKEYSLRNLRSGCSNSLVAADGLLNMPCFSYGCVCNYPLQTSFAMRHMPESAEWAGERPFQLLKSRE